MTNYKDTVLYTGVTNNLIRRVSQHKTGLNKNSFTSRYKVTKLVYFEAFNNSFDAISREKQIKAGSRKAKLDLINLNNAGFKDLSFELEYES